jgi:LAO/AO transport system ATPase
MSRPERVLIAKIGLDGHDRGAKLIVRNLRDAGMEVIYTGLWQTPETTVHAALQEDVDAVGVSLLSAAHMTIMPEIIRLRKRAGLDHLPVMVGGIIPEPDHAALREMGCAAVFNPGAPMSDIVASIRRCAADYRARRDLAPPPDPTTPVGLARAITHVIEERFDRSTVSDASSSVRIGVTGAPGVGKSTMIGRLAQELRGRGRRVAVVAVDPTSPVSGGSLLGDRLRMMRSQPDEGLFVRSLSSSGRAGGLAPHTDEVASLLASAGYEIVIIETVGAGQNDVEIRDVADEVLLLVMPAAGDALQFSKAGVVEIATAFVVNKSDLPGADKTIRDLRDTLHDPRPIWRVSSLRGEGLTPVCEWIEKTLAERVPRREPSRSQGSV